VPCSLPPSSGMSGGMSFILGKRFSPRVELRLGLIEAFLSATFVFLSAGANAASHTVELLDPVW